MAASSSGAAAPVATAFTWEAGAAIAIVVAANLLCYLLNSRSLLWRACACHVSTVLVSNRREGVPPAQAPLTWFAWDLISSKDVVTSGAIGVQGLTLYRAFEVVVFAFTTAYGNVLYEPAGGSFFVYFTNWTFCLFGLTGLLGTSLTAKEWARRRRPTLPCIEPAKPPVAAPGWHALLRAYQLLLATVCSASIMLTIFYWFADYTPGSELRFDNPVKHGASALLLLGDVLLSRTPVVSYHLQVVIAYGTLYLAFMWSYYAATATWVYRALDWSKPLSVGFYAALPLLLALGFTVMSLAACLRELLRRQRCCRRKPAVAPSSSLGAAAADGWRYGGGGSKEAVCYAAQPEPVGAGGYGGLHHMPAAAGGPSHPPSPRPAF